MIKSYSIILTIFLITQLMLGGCTNTSSESSIIAQKISGTQMLIQEDFEGGTCRFLSADTLVFWSQNPAYRYSLAMLKSDSIISLGNVCPVGQGPRESTMASMFADKDGNLFSFTSFFGQRAIFNKHSAAAADFIGEPIHLDSIIGSLSCFDSGIIYLSEDSILIVGGDANNLKQIFSIIDIRNKKLIPLDYWPDDGFRGNDFIKSKIYIDNARLFTDNKGKYVYCTGPNRNAFIFTIDGTHINIEKVLFDNPIKYEAASDGINYKYDPEPERLRMKATPDAIYFLMIDKDVSGTYAKNSSTSNYGDVVMKYDWNGNLLNKYRLDRVVFNINVADNDSTLYCQTENPETGETLMYRYSLK